MTYISRRNAIGLLAGATTATLATPSLAQAKPKIAFILNGTPGDVGWNYEHERGIAQAKAAFGDQTQIDTFYGVKEWGEEDAAQLETLSGQGYDMIFACSFGYMQSMMQAAFAAPDIKFEHCGGFVRTGNMSTYSARWYEGRVPQGLIAGTMTKTNKIGYLASFPIPQILRGINAAYLAAKSANPDVEFEVVWLNSWFSPEREEEVSRQLIANGADVLLAHTNSTKPTEVAEDLGAFAFGQASDMSAYGPNATLSATINNWGPYYVRQIGAMLDGSWSSTNTWGGFADEMIAAGEFSDQMPNRLFLKAADTVERLGAGQMNPFVGPVRRQDGSAWLAPGETASDRDLLKMDFFVEGLTGVIPSTGN
ncbi:BMP family ABC transporter substrate-binding protein [Yoonia sp. 2307UL14-13]|uniref:BMP family ABC transporter substrate-binding protein n=1 Tax=Yoonia sp. 2307UL14-13 TaxID=3126506 RepID=UPI0030B21164